MSNADQFRIIVTVDGKPLGEFETLSGGETTAEVGKRRPGGMRASRARNAQADHGDVTVSREFERERDHELLRGLRKRVGRAKVSVSEQPLDDDGAPWGKPSTYIGKLSGVSPSERDANSGDAATFELTVVVEDIL